MEIPSLPPILEANVLTTGLPEKFHNTPLNWRSWVWIKVEAGTVETSASQFYLFSIAIAGQKISFGSVVLYFNDLEGKQI